MIRLRTQTETQSTNSKIQRVLTQLGDADLLQILPGEVFDDADGVVAIFGEFFVVLREADGTEPLAEITL